MKDTPGRGRSSSGSYNYVPCIPSWPLHVSAPAQSRFRQPRLPQGPGRFRTDPHPVAGGGLRNRAQLRRCRRGGGQHLRLHRFGRGRIPRRHWRGAGRERQGHRHRLPGQALRTDSRSAPGCAFHQRPAGLRLGDECRARRLAAPARSLHRPAARHRREADAQALRLPEDFRRLQPPLQLLHYPVHARRPGIAAGGRGVARGRETRGRRRARAAGRVTGHQRLWRGRALRRARMARQVLPDPHEGPVRGTVRTRRVDAPALCVSVSARGRHHSADGRRPPSAVPGHSVPACQPAHPQIDETPGRGGQDARAHPALAWDLSRHHHPQHLHRRFPRRDRSRVRSAARLPGRGGTRSRRRIRLFAGGRCEGQ